MFIPDPNFSIPDPGSKRFQFPDPLSCWRILVLPQIFSKPLIFYPSRITYPGVKTGTGSRSGIRIRNTLANSELWINKFISGDEVVDEVLAPQAPNRAMPVRPQEKTARTKRCTSCRAEAQGRKEKGSLTKVRSGCGTWILIELPSWMWIWIPVHIWVKLSMI